MLVNKDHENEHPIRVVFHDEAAKTDRSFGGSVTMVSYGKAQYQWHPAMRNGFADPDDPPAKTVLTAGPETTYSLPPASITVLRGRLVGDAGGLSFKSVRQFICFGRDDNGYSGMEGSGAPGGLHFLTERFASSRNPPGTGNRRTFGGAPRHYSFYVNTVMIAPPNGRPTIYGGSASERRMALDRFLEDTLTHPQVRVVSHSELLEWMTHPQALR
jgi:hypothetical protein